MQGHALYTRQAGSKIPCPYVDYDAGFNAVFARAYGLEDGETIAKLFGKDWGEHDNDIIEHMPSGCCMYRATLKFAFSGCMGTVMASAYTMAQLPLANAGSATDCRADRVPFLRPLIWLSA